MSDAGGAVRVDREGDVVWLTLDRPERLNALSMAMRDQLWTALGLLRDDHLSKDLLEERARVLLGFADPRDYIGN